jgi:tetratricopeptide (TPR) repeat protein
MFSYTRSRIEIYGSGLVYVLINPLAQERYQLAEIHFRKALAINPLSPILMCHVAVVQHALQKSDRALDTLQAAIGKQPHQLFPVFFSQLFTFTWINSIN